MRAERLDIRDTFLKVVDLVEGSRVAHAFVGALAVVAWGRVRATSDIDLVVLAETGWAALEGELHAAGFRTTKSVGPVEEGDPLPDVVMLRPSEQSAVRVDVFLAKTAFEREVVASARTAEVFGRSIPLARPEASIVYKLIASRPKDLEDVEGIFEARRAAQDALDWRFLERWARAWGVSPELMRYRERYA